MKTFNHPAAGNRESAGATEAREYGLRPLSEVTTAELAAAARLMGYDAPTKAEIRRVFSDPSRQYVWHHVERGGRVKREYFTSPMQAVGAVERNKLYGTQALIDEQRRLGYIR